MASRKTSYTRAFGGGTDNLWETVDTIMVDLMTQQVSGDSAGLSEDVDLEKRKNNSKKDAELNELMENLDHVLDDLRDISSISNDPATPPKLINTSAEKLKARRINHQQEFLEKENPFDPITQGLLYQTADVPLFASSDQLAAGAQAANDGERVVISDASEFFEATEHAWEDYLSTKEGKYYSEQMNGSSMSDNGNNSTFSEEGNGVTHEKTRKNIKDRINIFQELSKGTSSLEFKHKDRPGSVHHNIISPTTSFRSRPFSTTAAIMAQQNSRSPSSTPSSSPPSNSSSSSSSSSSSFSSSFSNSSPIFPVASPSQGSRPLPTPPTNGSTPLSPKPSPQIIIPDTSQSSTSSNNATQSPQMYRAILPPKSPTNLRRISVPISTTAIAHTSTSPTNASPLASVSHDVNRDSPSTQSSTPSNVPSELNLSSSAPDFVQRGRLNTRLGLILTTELPLPNDALLDIPKKQKQRNSFHPSIRSSDGSSRSQINIGVRTLRVSSDSTPSNSPIPTSESTSSTLSIDTNSSTSPSSSTLSVSNSHVTSPPIPIPGTADSDSSDSPSPRSFEEGDEQPDTAKEPLSSPTTQSNAPTVVQLREASMRRVLSSPHLRGPQKAGFTRNGPPLQRISSQNSLLKQRKDQPRNASPPSSLSSSAENTPPPSSSPPLSSQSQSQAPSQFSGGVKPKSLRLTPVGQHRTTTSTSRLIFGGDGLSVHMPTSPSTSRTSSSSSLSLSSENCTNNTNTNTPATTTTEPEGITRRPPTSEVKERNAKIKQLRDLTRRYRAKLGQLESKYVRESQELIAQITLAQKEAAMHIKTCTSWGHHVLTKACRASWQLKIVVMQHKQEMRFTQVSLLQVKMEIVDQLMQLLEIEYRQESVKNDFIIYSSFFKDPTEVMTNVDVDRITRVLPALMREKRRAKIELHRLRITYQPEPLERRIRRLKDILVRMLPSPLISSYYLADDILQSDFDSLVTDQRLLEGRHIQHLINFLQDDLVGDRSITPNEVTDFLEQFAFKMSETFGVSQQDLGRLLLLCKRTIYPRIYPLLVVPAAVYEEDKQLSEKLAWLNKLHPDVLREGLKLDNRPFQAPNAAAAYEPAIEALNELAFISIPTEMAIAVHKCFKLTHDITQSLIKASGGPAHSEMGLDDVFPVFLWVVTQSQVSHLCKCVYFMEYYSDSDEKISALGYSATSLAAAVAHLGMIDKESFLPPVVP